MRARAFAPAVVAALLALPPPASAQARKGTSPKAQARPSAVPAAAADGLSVAGWIGYEWGDHVDGFQLRADGELPFQWLSPQVKLSFVGSLGYTHSTYGAFGVDLTVNRFKVVPAARFTIPVNPQLSLFGDAGIGLHYTSVHYDYSLFTASDSGLGLMLRFGAGAFYHLNPRVRLGGELVLDPIFGTYHDNTFSLLVGLAYLL
jgi:Outer membrane protein beta-barrel domain